MTNPEDELQNPSTPNPSPETQANNLNQTPLTVNDELDANNQQLPMLPTHETAESTQPNYQTHHTLIIADSLQHLARNAKRDDQPELTSFYIKIFNEARTNNGKLTQEDIDVAYTLNKQLCTGGDSP
jgi:hypothetical protein